MRVSLWVFGFIAFVQVSSVARADKLLLFPSDGEKASDIADALKNRLERNGHEVVLASASLEDTALMLGCEPSSDDCLDQVATAVEADGVVIAEMTDPPTLVVRRDGSTVRREVAADAESFAAAITSIFGGEPSPTDTEPEEAETEPVAPVDAAGVDPEDAGNNDAIEEPASPESRPGGSFSLSRVRGRTWIVLGGGAVVTGVGLALLSAASSRQDEVDRHPTDTVEDLQNLVALEDSGRAYTLWGNVTTIAGVGALVAGGVLLVLDQRSETDSAPAVTAIASTSGFSLGLAWTLD